MEKAIAIVVTYNRISLLSECITALRNQTRKLDAILVVNNGSTDGTEQWLRNQSDLVYITQKNSGSGGGFSTGINWAYNNGYSWIWCMDDDGYPKEDAMEMLLKNETPERSLMNCAVICKEDKKSFVWKTGEYRSIDEVETKVIKNIGHPFNGTLIHRSIVEKVGTPRSSFFLWGDETEYYYRIIRKNNIPVYTVTDSIHYHPASAFSYKKDWDFNSSWKMYFYVRNRFHVHKAKYSNKFIAWLHYFSFIIAFAGIIMIYQKSDKFKKLNFIFWPATDAIRNDFSATPAVILEKLKSANQSYPRQVYGSIRYFWSVLSDQRGSEKSTATV
jgi:rhamnopyranosyl-N-acetylglucosaminyl-diphospho-decaprenol beta-1,3/1,4-galactofuranosyltransferase